MKKIFLSINLILLSFIVLGQTTSKGSMIVGTTTSFSLNAGSYLAFAMNKEARFDGDSEDLEALVGDISGMDFGLDFGASYLINETMLLDIKYGMGLGNLIDDDVDEVALNGALQFSVAYVFNN